MNRSVEFLLCNMCKSEVIPLWKDTREQQQDYVHRKNLSAFCDYKDKFLQELEKDG